MRWRVMIVGLGNIGMHNTRHNIGFEFIDYLADLYQVQLKPHTCAFHGQHSLDDAELTLIRPNGFMNTSGINVLTMYKHYRPEHLVVVHDELDKKLGYSGWKSGGSANGHNGVRSVADRMGTCDFARLRLGIGRPISRHPQDISPYVLGEFTNDERDKLRLGVFPQAHDQLMKQIKILGNL
jgi:peptidyl-tRNA hydrolase, PTH1 family